jgi:hypothetical protein
MYCIICTYIKYLFCIVLGSLYTSLKEQNLTYDFLKISFMSEILFSFFIK